MMAYEKLDAWKACHALVLAVHHATKDHARRDDDPLRRLDYTALRAAGKLAFGAGTRNRKMFIHAAHWSAGYLAEFGYYLGLTRVIGILPEDLCARLDALRGRAAFYTWHLLESLLAPPPAADGA